MLDAPHMLRMSMPRRRMPQEDAAAFKESYYT
jgi:hypothetical protein